MKIYEIEERIKTIVRHQLDLPAETKIDSQDANFLEKYNINSIDALELLLMIESEFEIEIDDADLNSDLLSSVSDIAKYVENLLYDAKH